MAIQVATNSKCCMEFHIHNFTKRVSYKSTDNDVSSNMDGADKSAKYLPRQQRKHRASLDDPELGDKWLADTGHQQNLVLSTPDGRMALRTLSSSYKGCKEEKGQIQQIQCNNFGYDLRSFQETDVAKLTLDKSMKTANAHIFRPSRATLPSHTRLDRGECKSQTPSDITKGSHSPKPPMSRRIDKGDNCRSMPCMTSRV